MAGTSNFLRMLTTIGAALLAASAAVSGYAGQEGQFAVIVSRASPVEEFSIYELKHLFTGDMPNGPGGMRLVPLNLPSNSAERAAFDKVVLGMSPEQTARFWVDRKIRGQSGAPKNVDSPELLQRVVSKLDGGVGYVPANQVGKDVKVVRIDGKRPGEGGYKVTF